jgi:hypothetical protein
MGAGALGAIGVQTQSVVRNCKALGFGNRVLSFLNLRVVKLFDPTAVEADQVVVVLPFIQFVHRFAALKVAATQNARLLELGQYPVDGGQAHIGAFLQQNAKHIFRGHVPLSTSLKHFQDLEAWDRGFEARVLQFFDIAHRHIPGMVFKQARKGLPLQ